MFWMRADGCAAVLAMLHNAHCSGEPRRPYPFLKKASRAAPRPPTPSAARPEALRGNKLGTPKRVDCLGCFFVAGQDLAV